MPKFHVYSYPEMVEYMDGMAVDSEIHPGDYCGLGIGWDAARQKAKEEKATLPEKDWSLITLLTDWGDMFNYKYPQLKENSIYDNTGHVIVNSNSESGIIFQLKIMGVS